MAGASDDDVPGRATTIGHDEKDGRPTTAVSPSDTSGAQPKASSAGKATDDEEERTFREALDSNLRGIVLEAERERVVEEASPPVPPVPPAPASRPAMTRPAAALGVPTVGPLVLPGVIQIRLMGEDEESAAETKVQPRFQSPSEIASGASAEASPAVNAKLGTPIPAAGRRPGDDAVAHPTPRPASRTAPPDDAYDAEESVTTRGPPVGPYDDESITAEAPVTRPRPIPPSDDDTESVTTRASGPDLLRAALSDRRGGDDDSAANETVANPSAPVKQASNAPSRRVGPPVVGPTHTAGNVALAHFPESVTPSGLRLLDGAPDGDSSSHYVPQSSGILRHREAAPGAPLAFGAAPHGYDSSSVAFAPTEHAFGSGPISSAGPSREDEAEAGQTPRYVLLVALVAFLSLAIPLALFFYLHERRDEGVPRTAAEVASDPVTLDEPARAKSAKGAPTTAPTEPAPLLSASGAGSAKAPPPLPRHR